MKYAIIVALWAFAAAWAPPQARAQQDSARTPAPADTTKRDAESFARHAIYAELLGNGISASINYEFRFIKNISVRVGIPPLVMINMLGGQHNSFFELGAGYGYGAPTHIDLGGGSGNSPEAYDYFTITLAYRYQPRDGGLFFKTGLTPIFSRKQSGLSFGIALGYTF